MSTKPKIVFSDFDGTLTHHEQLVPKFFELLEFLESHQIPLVICTGRSKSWAHFLLTHFHSLKHVISEGGGTLTVVEEKDGRRLLRDHSYTEEGAILKLEKVTAKLLQKFPDVELSADSFGREADRAIELSYLEDNPEIDQEIRAFFDDQNVNYSTSNVHMNFWCGEISKMNAMRLYIAKYHTVTEEEVVFYGDSLNDESVFKELKNSVGVSNIDKVLNRFKFPPQTILKGKENEGPFGVYAHLETLLK